MAFLRDAGSDIIILLLSPQLHDNLAEIIEPDSLCVGCFKIHLKLLETFVKALLWCPLLIGVVTGGRVEVLTTAARWVVSSMVACVVLCMTFF